MTEQKPSQTKEKTMSQNDVPSKSDDEPRSYICCEELEKALGDHRGLYSQGIYSRKNNTHDAIILYTGGEYKLKNPIVVQYCPFCGKPRIRLSQATKAQLHKESQEAKKS